MQNFVSYEGHLFLSVVKSQMKLWGGHVSRTASNKKCKHILVGWKSIIGNTGGEWRIMLTQSTQGKIHKMHAK